MLARQPPEEADHGWITTRTPSTSAADRPPRSRFPGARSAAATIRAWPSRGPSWTDPAHDIARIQHRDPVAPGEVVFDHRRVGHRQSANGSAGGDRRRAEAGHRRVRWRRRGTQPYQRGLNRRPRREERSRPGKHAAARRRPKSWPACRDERNRFRRAGRALEHQRSSETIATSSLPEVRREPASACRRSTVPEVGAAIGTRITDARASARAAPHRDGRPGRWPAAASARPRAARHPTRACGTRPRSPRARRGRRAAPSAIR